MPQRKCTKTKVTATRACKRITLPIKWELYKQLIGDDQLFRSHLDQMIELYPELFPAQIAQGYRLHDKRTSQKMPEVTLRRIKLNTLDKKGRAIVATMAPSAILSSYMGVCWRNTPTDSLKNLREWQVCSYRFSCLDR